MKIYPTYLPNEILSIIINEFAGPSDTEDNDLETLAACRLASYTLCSLATPLLFSSIQLAENRTTYNGFRSPVKEGAVKLNQLLTNKDIAASVRTLTLKLCSMNFENSTSSMITEILHRLPHIRDFTLEAWQEYRWEGYHMYRESEQIPFDWIAEDLALAIQDLVTSPKLTKLELSNICDFPLVIITACPNLQHLCLSNIDFFVKSHLFFLHFPKQLIPYSSTRMIQMSYQACKVPTYTPWRLTRIAWVPLTYALEKMYRSQNISHDSRICELTTNR